MTFAVKDAKIALNANIRSVGGEILNKRINTLEDDKVKSSTSILSPKL